MNKHADAATSGLPDFRTSGLLPPHLKKGDKIAITCPAKKLPAPMTDAVNLLRSWGLEVVLGENNRSQLPPVCRRR